MEMGSIEREVHIDASPEIVFEVITSPEHIRVWWGGAETDVAPQEGLVSEIAWGKDSADPHLEHLTVVEVDAPRRFSFRWVADGAAVATAANSLLVTFELTPDESGTLLRMTESGFREKGWEAAVLEDAYADHVRGWDLFIPSLGAYAAAVAAAR
jgi:uncharacterized protein YndB with AHSA1/START domain